MTNGVLNIYVLEELARTRAAEIDLAARRRVVLVGGDRDVDAHALTLARIAELAVGWRIALLAPARRRLAGSRAPVVRTTRPMGCTR